MSLINPKSPSLTDKDLDFLVETASPEVTDKVRLKQILREDEAVSRQGSITRVRWGVKRKM